MSEKANERLHQLSYVILVLLIVLSIVFSSQTIIGTQLMSGIEKGGYINTYFCPILSSLPLETALPTKRI
ncbi:MAG: hypothetical protein WC046_03780 [Candidatus Bathyarchaeia archaeon]